MVYSDAGAPDGPADPWRLAAVPAEDVDAPSIQWGPWNRNAIRALAVIITAAIAVAAWWAWSGRPRELVVAPSVIATGVPIVGIAGSASPVASTPSTVVVHVVGQVRHPGIVTLPQGSRIADAVLAAGGVNKKGADDSVNLARILVDGEQVIVGFGAQAVAGVLGIASAPAPGALMNLNTADASAFEELPGVGPVLADRIVQWRTTNGPFRSVDELSEVSGIGDAIMGQIRPMVTV